jgi:glycosyltransferase involved in cell wall biosynthesis
MKALAIIPAYNEADIIGWTVRHLQTQCLDVLVLDSGSTDGTAGAAVAAGALVIPAISQVATRVSWRGLLGQVEHWAAEYIGQYGWCMLCDADEIRRSTGDPASRDARRLVIVFEQLCVDGYNAADHIVCTFHPIDNGFDGSQDPEEYFRFYSVDSFNMRIGQVKAWRNDRPVELAWSGGHRVRYKDGTTLRVSPVKLISKHYPIRSQAQGERKVFQERRPRWSDPEKDWHVQYAGIQPGHNFLRNPAELKEWK